MKDDILRYAKGFLNDSSIDNTRLLFFVDEIYEEILIYCRRDDFPEVLNSVAGRMVALSYQQQTAINQGGSVNSMTEDGRTINFSLDNALKLLSADERPKITRLLDRYKKMFGSHTAEVTSGEN